MKPLRMFHRQGRLRRKQGRRRPAWLTPHVYLFVVVFPVVVALSLVWFIELEYPAARNPVQVLVTGDPGTSAQELYTGVKSFAEDETVAVALSVREVQDPSQRTLRLHAPADSGLEDWIAQGYPRVLFAPDTKVVPLAENSVQSAAGMYLVYGSVSKAESLASVVREHGYAAEVHDSSLWSVLSFKASLLYSIVSCWVLGATALVASTFSKSRGYAIMRFWGNPAGSVLLRELLRVWRYCWPRLLVLALVGLAVLGFLGRWPGLAQVSAVALPMLGLMLAATLAVHVASLGLAYYLPDTLAAIRGRIQHLPLMSLSFAIRLPVAFLLVMTSVAVVGNVSSVRDTQDVLRGLGPAGQAQRLAISELAASEPDEQTEIFLGIGRWLGEVDSRAEAVISQPVQIEPNAGMKPEMTVLVNPTYLSRHTVLLSDGSAMRAHPDDLTEVVIGVPEARMGQSQALVEKIVEDLNLNLDDHLAGKLSPRVVPLADGQDVFTYGAQEFGSLTESVALTAPVVVALPGAVLSPSFYASVAGQGGYLFTDPDKAISEATTNPAITKYVRWIQPPARPVLDKYRERVGDLLASLTALVFLTAALVGTSFGVSVVYRTERAQRTMARRLFGWSLWRTCGRAFGWELALYVMVVGYFVIQISNHIGGTVDPVVMQQRSLAALTQVLSILAVIAIAAASLTVFLRRACTAAETARNS